MTEKVNVTQLARIGAELQIQKHREAIDSLEKFLNGRPKPIAKATLPLKTSRRRSLTPAEREAISRRMKRYHRERRRANVA